ncbi:MAG: hypothetical protein ACK54H_08105 [Phycisphaerales bacterium]
MRSGWTAGLALRSVAASLWAAAMIMLGLGLIFEGQTWFELPREVYLFAGISAVCGGQFVFMVLVADRLLKGVHRRSVVWTEALAFVSFLLGAGGAITVLTTGITA